MSLLPRNVLADDGTYIAPVSEQMAALCWRKSASGREVLLVTSTTGRWIIPKGRPIRGKDGGQTALIEAWEEAGVRRARVGKRPVGRYIAAKRTLAGDDLGCRVSVYAVEVREMADDFPEAANRARRWVTPAVAAGLVTEDGLRDILARFA